MAMDSSVYSDCERLLAMSQRRYLEHAEREGCKARLKTVANGTLHLVLED